MVLFFEGGMTPQIYVLTAMSESISELNFLSNYWPNLSAGKSSSHLSLFYPSVAFGLMKSKSEDQITSNLKNMFYCNIFGSDSRMWTNSLL